MTHSLKDRYRYIHSSLFTVGISSGSYRSQEWPQYSGLEQAGEPRKALAIQSFQRPETGNEAREREENDISASSSLELCKPAALMSEQGWHMSQLWLRTPFPFIPSTVLGPLRVGDGAHSPWSVWSVLNLIHMLTWCRNIPLGSLQIRIFQFFR